MGGTTRGRALDADAAIMTFEPIGYARALQNTLARTGFGRTDKDTDASDFCVEGALDAGDERSAMAPPATPAECVAGRQAWRERRP